jgi:hypothetical protein
MHAWVSRAAIVRAEALVLDGLSGTSWATRRIYASSLLEIRLIGITLGSEVMRIAFQLKFSL